VFKVEVEELHGNSSSLAALSLPAGEHKILPADYSFP
jgi:hypothetical protein